jgi:hypothetical protein
VWGGCLRGRRRVDGPRAAQVCRCVTAPPDPRCLGEWHRRTVKGSPKPKEEQAAYFRGAKAPTTNAVQPVHQFAARKACSGMRASGGTERRGDPSPPAAGPSGPSALPSRMSGRTFVSHWDGVFRVLAWTLDILPDSCQNTQERRRSGRHSFRVEVDFVRLGADALLDGSRGIASRATRGAVGSTWG